MSQMNELSQVVTELRRCGDVLIGLSESLKGLFSSADASAEEGPVAGPATEEKKHTLEDVRAVLARKSNEGHTAEIQALIKKYGASKLSQIDPSKYDAMLAEAEVL